MKTINVTFEEDEWKLLVKAKGKASWHDFILQLLVEG
jgi:predicted CopG family antitoxin